VIHLRKNLPGIIWGNWNFIETNSPQVIAMRYDWNGKSIVTMHNLSNQLQQVELKFKNNITNLQRLIDNKRLTYIIITANYRLQHMDTIGII
jgi:maltose alpha-D-glucosyltransferase/alpha-amylase